MGTVTIVNKTNFPINSCISAGVNYSWVNKLLPGEYYEHNGVAGVYTLSTRYWMGEATEFSNSGTEIGLWVAGIAIGIVGLALAPFTGGATVGGVAAIYAVLGSAALGTAGTALSGIAIAIKDFANEPSSWTNIHALENRRFVADGVVILQPDAKTGVVTVTDALPIKIGEIGEKEYQELINKKEWQQHGQQPLSLSPYFSEEELAAGKMLDCNIQILPAAGGDAAWEIESDLAVPNTPLQLWSRGIEPKTFFRITAAEWARDLPNAPGVQLFTIWNSANQMYAKARGDRVLAANPSRADHDQLFYIAKSEGGYVFKSYTSGRLVVPEDGNTGDSTKLVLVNQYGPNPFRALWKIVKR